jgi:hypothetical protein
MDQNGIVGKYLSLKALKSHFHRIPQTISFVQEFELFDEFKEIKEYCYLSMYMQDTRNNVHQDIQNMRKKIFKLNLKFQNSYKWNAMNLR